MQAIAQAIDEDLLAMAVSKAGYRHEGTADATDLSDLAALGKHLDLAKAPAQNRSLVLHPEHKYRYALTENLSNVAYAGDNETLRNALLGRVYTLDTYMDQNAPDSNAAEPGDAINFVVSGTKGECFATVASLQGSVEPGDAFILDGVLYRFVEGGVGKLAIDQPLMNDYSLAKITVVNKPCSVAFHRNGLALVTRNLALPMGASNAAYASAGGLGVRVVYDYDSATKTDKISFDVVYGIRELDSDLICSLVG